MSSPYDPGMRELLDARGGEIYREAVDQGSILPADPRLDEDHPDRPVIDLLLEVGLLAHDPVLGAFVAVDPATVQSRVVAPMGQRAAELLTESTHWANTFGALGTAYRRGASSANPITELRGLPNINRFIQAAVADAAKELLTAQPAGARSAATLRVALERDTAALERGVEMRTLYQHSARRSIATRDYVEEVLQHGAHVRTLDEFFNRLIVVDRSLAIVPGVEGTHVAIAVRDQSLVAYLVDVFDRYWERARDFTDRGESTVRDVAEDVANMTVRMLVEGHSDQASAKRVGVSTRTYAGYVAALKDEHEAQTRFQLGYAMGLRDGITAATSGDPTGFGDHEDDEPPAA